MNTVKKVLCRMYLAKGGQWFNQGHEYTAVYAATKSGHMRYHVSMSADTEPIPLTDMIFDKHFEII